MCTIYIHLVEIKSDLETLSLWYDEQVEYQFWCRECVNSGAVEYQFFLFTQASSLDFSRTNFLAKGVVFFLERGLNPT